MTVAIPSGEIHLLLRAAGEYAAHDNDDLTTVNTAPVRIAPTAGDGWRWLRTYAPSSRSDRRDASGPSCGGQGVLVQSDPGPSLHKALRGVRSSSRPSSASCSAVATQARTGFLSFGRSTLSVAAFDTSGTSVHQPENRSPK